MSAVPSVISAAPSNLSEAVEIKRPSEAITERESSELVIAFAGPIGCGIKTVRDQVESQLTESGYKVHIVKLSEYLKDCVVRGLVKIDGDLAEKGAERYIQMQDAGNSLRKIQSDILAEYAIRQIAETRGTEAEQKQVGIKEFVPSRVAYLIDQVKHPDEVVLLRAVYGNLFYLFGVLSTSPRREARLKAEGIEPGRISELIERDRKQREKNGQQLDKALQLADFFVRNDHANIEGMENQTRRFMQLIHGVNGVTPTKEEYGMYVAYAAALRSGCLSRQVGASIMSAEGAIVATGRNDVPKAGGGLYGPESGKDDARCVKLENGYCHNDLHKQKLTEQIRDVVQDILGQYIANLDWPEHKQELQKKINIGELADKVSSVVHGETRLGSLIEFSRSIHAEMDAIVSLAMKGEGTTKGAVLFTYTFPCHNCARHIVAAGISTVYYLEPYEKSLALALHDDAIAIDGIEQEQSDGKKVRFVHFEGVAPRQYLNMFSPSGERKDKTGRAVVIKIRDSSKKVPAYLDGYRDYELKVVEHLTQVINDLSSATLQ